MLPSFDDMVLNILAFYAEATADERRGGRAWYAAAYEVAENIARRTGLAVDTVVAVIAVLSPQQEWESNVAWAIEVCEAWVAGNPLPRRGLGNSLLRAERALRGDTSDVLRTKGSLKVYNFYMAILSAPGAVAVDRHAIRVALGDPNANPPALSDGRYALVADAYRAAASELRTGVRHVQAVTWVVVKRAREAHGAYADLPSWWRLPASA